MLRKSTTSILNFPKWMRELREEERQQADSNPFLGKSD